MGIFDYIKKVVGVNETFTLELKSYAESFVAKFREENDDFDEIIEDAKGITNSPEILSANDFMNSLEGLEKLDREDETSESVAASLGVTKEEIRLRKCLIVITYFYAAYLCYLEERLPIRYQHKIIKILHQIDLPLYKLAFVTIKPAYDRSPVSLDVLFGKIVRIKNVMMIALSKLQADKKIDLKTYNSLNEAIQNNDFEQFKKIVFEFDERILIALSRVINNYFNLLIVYEGTLTEDINSLDVRATKKFLSNIVTTSDGNFSAAVCKLLLIVYFYEDHVVRILNSDLSDAIDSIWEIVNLKDFKNLYSNWCIDQVQELMDNLDEQIYPFNNLLDDIMESRKDKKIQKKSHISVNHDIRIIEKLVGYLVKGYDGASGHLKNLVSSKDGNEKTQLLYLFTGNPAYNFDGPYKLEWNGEGPYLKLLIQLLHNKSKLKTPGQAIDPNQTDYISRTNIKTSFKGVWGKVGEAFERSGDSLKGAVFADEKKKKKKKEDETKTLEEIELDKQLKQQLKQQRINEMTLIAEMWLKCLNEIDFND